MKANNPKRFTYFVGVDVSRNELDYAVMQGNNLLFHKETKNEPEAIMTQVNELKSLPGFTVTKSVFCMEHTGFYCNHLILTLKKIKANIVLENALQIKNSLGLIRGKSDKIDAIRIAQYAYTNRENLRIKEQPRQVIIQLSSLVTLRKRLIGIQMALKTPIKEESAFINSKIHKSNVSGCKRSVEAIGADLINVEESIAHLINSDGHLKRLMNIITSVPFIGKITALHIIITTNEFKDINCPKKFACYCGVAPFPKESGKKIRKSHISHLANKKIKSLLHICAVGSLRGNEDLRNYYLRKVEEGKPKMAVINAIRYKLINRIFACVNQGRIFTKEYSGQMKLQQVN